MPQNHQHYIQRNGNRFYKGAAQIGPYTNTLVAAIIGSYKVEQQGYTTRPGLLKPAIKYTHEQLENASKKALTFTPRPFLVSVGRESPLRAGQKSPIVVK